jgi:virginiamycin B lyase
MSASSPPSQVIKEYSLPPNAGPLALSAGGPGTFWFTEFTAGRGEFFSENATIREFAVPESKSQPAYVVVGPDGAVWFSDQKSPGSIWQFDPSNHHFQQYVTETSGSTPLGVLVDGQNNVWFAELTGDKLGELAYPSRSLKEFALPTSNSGPAELAFSANGSVIWITETYASQIASFDKRTQSFREFNPSVSMKSPVGVVTDKSDNVWVAEHGGSSIIEFKPGNSTFWKYPTSVPPVSSGYSVSAPATLAVDSGGHLWFVEHCLNRVGRLDPLKGTIDEFPIPTPGAYSVLNALDSKGNFWFTEFSANEIGVVPANATSPLGLEFALGRTVQADPGQTVSAYLTISNRLSSGISVHLTASSSFTSTGQTPGSEVGLTPQAIDLAPKQSVNISAVVSPTYGLAWAIFGRHNCHHRKLFFDGNPLFQGRRLCPAISFARAQSGYHRCCSANLGCWCVFASREEKGH